MVTAMLRLLVGTKKKPDLQISLIERFAFWTHDEHVLDILFRVGENGKPLHAEYFYPKCPAEQFWDVEALTQVRYLRSYLDLCHSCRILVNFAIGDAKTSVDNRDFKIIHCLTKLTVHTREFKPEWLQLDVVKRAFNSMNAGFKRVESKAERRIVAQAATLLIVEFMRVHIGLRFLFTEIHEQALSDLVSTISSLYQFESENVSYETVCKILCNCDECHEDTLRASQYFDSLVFSYLEFTSPRLLPEVIRLARSVYTDVSRIVDSLEACGIREFRVKSIVDMLELDAEVFELIQGLRDVVTTPLGRDITTSILNSFNGIQLLDALVQQLSYSKLCDATTLAASRILRKTKLHMNSQEFDLCRLPTDEHLKMDLNIDHIKLLKTFVQQKYRVFSSNTRDLIAFKMLLINIFRVSQLELGLYAMATFVDQRMENDTGASYEMSFLKSLCNFIEASADCIKSNRHDMGNTGLNIIDDIEREVPLEKEHLKLEICIIAVHILYRVISTSYDCEKVESVLNRDTAPIFGVDPENHLYILSPIVILLLQPLASFRSAPRPAGPLYFVVPAVFKLLAEVQCHNYDRDECGKLDLGYVRPHFTSLENSCVKLLIYQLKGALFRTMISMFDVFAKSNPSLQKASFLSELITTVAIKGKDDRATEFYQVLPRYCQPVSVNIKYIIEAAVRDPETMVVAIELITSMASFVGVNSDKDKCKQVKANMWIQHLQLVKADVVRALKLCTWSPHGYTMEILTKFVRAIAHLSTVAENNVFQQYLLFELLLDNSTIITKCLTHFKRERMKGETAQTMSLQTSNCLYHTKQYAKLLLGVSDLLKESRYEERTTSLLCDIIELAAFTCGFEDDSAYYNMSLALTLARCVMLQIASENLLLTFLQMLSHEA
jgi:hypothetical protein